MTSDSTQWPVLDERAPFATASREGPRRRLPRSAWMLTGLAFLCGGLVSAAVFSIGWRHQAQRDTAARSALAAATARAHRLEQRISALHASLVTARRATARAHAAATAAEQTLARAGTKVGADATASSGEAASVSSGVGSLTAAARRIASELKTFDTYLTTTPTGQIDPGYIASQTSYLARQLTRLEGDAGGLNSSLGSFESALSKLTSDVKAIKTP
jgi:hypothetical protein